MFGVAAAAEDRFIVLHANHVNSGGSTSPIGLIPSEMHFPFVQLLRLEVGKEVCEKFREREAFGAKICSSAFARP